MSTYIKIVLLTQRLSRTYFFNLLLAQYQIFYLLNTQSYF